MDRKEMSPSTRRAWIEMPFGKEKPLTVESPSTRRAWIEIAEEPTYDEIEYVALHPEGVDRNGETSEITCETALSPSTRRAWIEIKTY